MNFGDSQQNACDKSAAGERPALPNDVDRRSISSLGYAMVELRLAYEWTCDECGRDQFIRASRLDPSQLSADELAELRDEHCVEPWETGEWSMRPQSVQCEFCGHSFDVESDA